MTWRPMKTAPRNGTPILLRFAESSGLAHGQTKEAGIILAQFDAESPKGNPWRVPYCEAFFGEMFDGWCHAPAGFH